ncbi:MAG TPA: hypothetical protein VFX43_03040 [Chitinophagaceae bacterium]|nr:hypothetical protein [Chitinophagaceae bacterium]
MNKDACKDILNLLKITICISVLIPCGLKSSAQDNHSVLRDIINQVTTATLQFPPEKTYLQTDKPSYNQGDTLWFKAYLFNAAYLNASSKSGVLYVEIADEENQVVKRRMVSLYDGLGWGDIALTKKEFPQGVYTLRAYTNWMRNFNEKCVFQKRFAIHDFSGNEWLVSARFRRLPGNGKQTDSAALVFKQVDGRPVAFRDLQIALTEGGKVWNKNKFQTDVVGALTFNFKVPSKADPHKLSITVKDLRKGSAVPQLTVPVSLQDQADCDLQFMPEGGSLLAGISNHVAFKAIGTDGRGCAVSGTIYNSEHQPVIDFTSSHLGMGAFYLKSHPKETYTAVVKLKGGKTRSYPLPPIKNSGTLLNVVNPFKSDSIEVNIRCTPDRENDTSHYYLIGQARGIGCFGALIVLDKGVETIHLPKSIFPTGITRLTLLDTNKRPLNTRLIFVDQHDELRPHLSYKKQYSTRDSVAMDISITDQTGIPVQGCFSLAVTDDAQVKTDTLRRNSMVSCILLSSDLKGFVEDPGYYFPVVMTKKIWKDLDQLLLTQGWVNYSIDTVTAHQRMMYPGEQSFSISGKVTNILNKPVAESKVVLFSQKPLSFRQTTTDKKGTFTFNNLYPVDTASYMIQARNKRGKSFNVGIELNAFQPPSFQPLSQRILPWYVNTDTGDLSIIHTRITNQEQIDKLLGKHVLKEVVVVGQKVIKDSKNLNGPGGSDFAMNAADMRKEGKATLGDILRQKVKGFRLGGKFLNVYLINTELVHLIIDGVNLDFFKPEGMSYKDYYKQYLDYLTAEDIKGIEVMTSAKYTMTYFQKFLNPMQKPFEHVFIEITTYSGNGAFLKKTPGVYLYRPSMAFGARAQFYSPKYSVKTRGHSIDARSTIYWKPDILTGKDGKARVSFYTADKPGTYTVILEGCDMNGHLTSIRRKMTVQ